MEQPEGKACTTCKVVKALAEFGNSRAGKDGKRWSCRTCEAAYYQQYLAGPGVRRLRNKVKSVRKKTMRKHIDALKEGPCLRCGYTFPPYCMDWDHTDSAGKVESVSRALDNSMPVAQILEEVGKCQLLCSNCHRIVTWERKQSYATPLKIEWSNE